MGRIVDVEQFLPEVSVRSGGRIRALRLLRGGGRLPRPGTTGRSRWTFRNGACRLRADPVADASPGPALRRDADDAAAGLQDGGEARAAGAASGGGGDRAACMDDVLLRRDAVHLGLHLSMRPGPAAGAARVHREFIQISRRMRCFFPRHRYNRARLARETSASASHYGGKPLWFET